MDDIKKLFEKLPDTLKKQGEFVYQLERLLRLSAYNKGEFFLQVGFILQKYLYFDLAIYSWNQALKHFIDTNNKKGELECYRNIGMAYRRLGDFRKAIEYHEKSLEIAIEIGDRVGESWCYANLGIAYSSLGDFRKAIEYHEKALEIAIETDDREGESSCYTNLGIAYGNLGNFRKAIEYHETSGQIVVEIRDKEGESTCYTNLGNAYHSLGLFKKAMEYYEKALEIAVEIEDRYIESTCYTNLGNAYHRLGDFRKAIEYHEKSLEIALEIENIVGESTCYTNLGILYDSLEDFRKAIEYHKKALEITIEIEDRVHESTCYTNLGNAYSELGDFEKAIEYQKKSLEIVKETGDIDLERIVNFHLGRNYYKSKSKPKIAYNYFKRSIELSETISAKLIQEEQMRGFHAHASDVYQYMIPLCLKLKMRKEAFEYIERSKSRVFLDMLTSTEIRPFIKITSDLKSLLGKEETLLSKIREIQTRRLKLAKVPVKLGEVEKTIKKLNQIYSKIEKFDPEYVFTRKGKPLPLNKVQNMLYAQKRNVVLIEYFITDYEIFILVVTSKDRELHKEIVPISKQKLYRYLENYSREIINYSRFKDIGDTWLDLSNYLIEPISKYLTEGDLIYFVPYDILHYLPMHALELKSEPLINKHPVAYSPSASIIKFCQNKGSDKLQSCASFGVEFEDEAEDVAELFNTKYYDQVTKDLVHENCTDKDIIHFSCHGYFDYIDPLSSGIMLYDKDILTSREIFDMRLNTELVTLSACETGLNQRSPADELIGLTRAFLYAGSPSVIVSLWSVDANSTKELMHEFYTFLKNGLDKASALQEAQKKIMKKENFSHPYYWAPFILVGDWELKKN